MPAPRAGERDAFCAAEARGPATATHATANARRDECLAIAMRRWLLVWRRVLQRHTSRWPLWRHRVWGIVHIGVQGSMGHAQQE